jgi:hypothetical protein
VKGTRLPKPPVRPKREKRREGNTPEVQALIDEMYWTGTPLRGDCSYLTAGTFSTPPRECGKPVIAIWYIHRVRGTETKWVPMLRACKQHDDNAAIFNLRRAPEMRHRRREVL